MIKFDQSTLGQINFEIRQIGNKYRNNLLEWNHVILILENEILPVVFEIINEDIEILIERQKSLQKKINQLSFGNHPERDRKIVELFDLGYSRGKIAKEVGMSKWGVSKALRRLGVN